MRPTNHKIPYQYWTIQDIAVVLGRSESHTRQRIVSCHTFPVAIKLPSEKNASQRIWRSDEVLHWIEQHREGSN